MGIIWRTFEYLDDSVFLCFSSLLSDHMSSMQGMESIFNETHNSTWKCLALSN